MKTLINQRTKSNNMILKLRAQTTGHINDYHNFNNKTKCTQCGNSQNTLEHIIIQCEETEELQKKIQEVLLKELKDYEIIKDILDNNTDKQIIEKIICRSLHSNKEKGNKILQTLAHELKKLENE